MPRHIFLDEPIELQQRELGPGIVISQAMLKLRNFCKSLDRGLWKSVFILAPEVLLPGDAAALRERTPKWKKAGGDPECR